MTKIMSALVSVMAGIVFAVTAVPLFVAIVLTLLLAAILLFMLVSPMLTSWYFWQLHKEL